MHAHRELCKKYGKEIYIHIYVYTCLTSTQQQAAVMHDIYISI
jgi:hypothetical protein